MKQLTLALLPVLALSGCVVETFADVYEDCSNTTCDLIDTFCTPVTADWPGDRTTSTSFCTNGCNDDLDCLASLRGNPGVCVDFNFTGPTCYESCVEDFDCPFGFRCGDAGAGVSICLPY